MQRKKTIGAGLFSLLMFLFIDMMMSSSFLTVSGKPVSSQTELVKTIVIALVLYLVPLALIAFKNRLGYYLLAIVQAVYLFFYVAAITLIFSNSKTWSFNISLLLILLIAVGMIANLISLYIGWRVRKATTKERLKSYMKFRK